MKKFSVILLIAVLAMTSVFADGITTDLAISGTATAEYVVDFNKGTFDYKAPDMSGLTMTLTLGTAEAPKKAAGEKFWAEMEASATVKQSITKGSKTATINPTITLALSKFNLNYADVWSVDFLKADDLTNLATSELTKVYDGTAKKPIPYDDAYTFDGYNGITFNWTKTGFAFAAAVNGDLKPTDATSVMANVKTPTFTLAKGFTLNAAGGVGYDYKPATTTAKTDDVKGYYYKNAAGTKVPVTSDDIICWNGTNANYVRVYNATTKNWDEFNVEFDVLTAGTPAATKVESMAWNIAGSLALNYKSEDGKIAVGAATDQAIGFGFANGAKTKLTYDVDADVKMTFGAATAEIYYAKNAAAYDAATGLKELGKVKNLLSAEAIMNLSMFHPTIKATFTGLNLLHKSSVLSTKLEIGLGDNFLIKAFANDVLGTVKRFNAAKGDDAVFYKSNFEGQMVGVESKMVFGAVTVEPSVYARIALKQLGYGAKATYKNTYFTVTGGVDGYFICEKNAKKSSFTVNAGITATDTIVKNATVSAVYKSNNLLMKNAAVDPLYGYRAEHTTKDAADLGAGKLTLSCGITF